MRSSFFTDNCFPCYYILKTLGITKSCIECNTDKYICSSKNYILHFTGKGKYNNKYLCLNCLEKKF